MPITLRSKRVIGREPRSSDRHKNKFLDRHTNKDYGHRCICGYSKCNLVRDGFRGTDSAYNRRPIHFRVPNNCREWDEFVSSLARNLHVPGNVGLLQMKKGERFNVCAHHFTDKVVQGYWNDGKMKKCWAQRFDRDAASSILHLPLDERDTDVDGKFFINANHPMEDAAQLAVTLHSDRSNRLASRSSSSVDSEKDALLRVTLEEKTARIRELEKYVAELQEERRKLKQSEKRKLERLSSANSDNKSLKQQLQQSISIQDVTEIILGLGGATRATIFNKTFHNDHPHAAKCLWGFKSYDETLVMVSCLFPDVNVNEVPTLKPPNKRRKTTHTKLSLPHHLTDLERCLICKLFFRRWR